MSRRVPDQFTTGGDRHNAQKAWLDGYDAAKAAKDAEIKALREFYDAQTEFDGESEDHDLPRWREAGDRLEAARAALTSQRVKP